MLRRMRKETERIEKKQHEWGRPSPPPPTPLWEDPGSHLLPGVNPPLGTPAPWENQHWTSREETLPLLQSGSLTLTPRYALRGLWEAPDSISLMSHQKDLPRDSVQFWARRLARQIGPFWKECGGNCWQPSERWKSWEITRIMNKQSILGSAVTALLIGCLRVSWDSLTYSTLPRETKKPRLET